MNCELKFSPNAICIFSEEAQIFGGGPNILLSPKKQYV